MFLARVFGLEAARELKDAICTLGEVGEGSEMAGGE